MFIAGPYTATYNGTNVGVTERGFELEYVTLEEPIIGDNMGDTVQDAVYTGANMFLNAVFQEYDEIKTAGAFWPFDSTEYVLGQVGRLKWDLGKSLVLTAVAGTRAATAGPATITASVAILAGGFPVRTLFASRHRNMPLRFQVLPFYSGATNTPVAEGAAAASATFLTLT